MPSRPRRHGSPVGVLAVVVFLGGFLCAALLLVSRPSAPGVVAVPAEPSAAPVETEPDRVPLHMPAAARVVGRK